MEVSKGGEKVTGLFASSLQEPPVELVLDGGESNQKDKLLLWREALGQHAVVTTLHCSRQQLVQNVGSLFHQSDIKGGGVSALAVCDGVHKTVCELSGCSKEVRLHKVDHCVVCVSGRSTKSVAKLKKKFTS